MFLWFAGLSLVLVWQVFRSPALDYRMVVLGSLLPLGDAALVAVGAPRVLHTLAAAVALLTVAMLATRRRRLVRRRWLGIPIGMFVHLVLDGVWTDGPLLWWPLLGLDGGDGGIPEVGRGAVVPVLMEVAGALALTWWWRRFSLADPARRHEFLQSGQLARDRAAQ